MIFGSRPGRGAQSEFERAVRRSLRASIEGDPARAQTWLERAVELDSSDVDVYQALARLYRERGEIGRAIRMHQNLLLRTDLERVEQGRAKLELARDFEAGGFAERALATLEELVAERPRDPEAVEEMAWALLGRGDRERAASLAARLRRLDPERARPLSERLGSGGRPGRSGLVSRFVSRLGGREEGP